MATIVGTFLAFRSQPAAFTTADWIQQANAACEQHAGALRMSIFDGLLPASATTGGTTSSSQRLTSLTQNWINEESVLNTEVGELSAIQTPHDAQARQIPAVISTGNTLAASMDDLANGFQAYIDGKTTKTQADAAVLQNGDHVLTATWAWQKALQPLGLTHCAFYAAHPATTPPTLKPIPAASTAPATPPAGSPTYSTAEEQLLSLLDPRDLTNCTPHPSAEVNGVIAALACQTVATGPAWQPVVVQFASPAAAQSWFSGWTSNFVDRDDCVDGYKAGPFTHGGTQAGQLGCAYTDGRFRMVWVINSALVGVIADGTSGPVMTQWWDSWSYVIGRS